MEDLLQRVIALGQLVSELVTWTHFTPAPPAPPPSNNLCPEPAQIYPNNNYIVQDNESPHDLLDIEEGIKMESEVDQEMLSGQLLSSPQYNGHSILEENPDNFRHPHSDPLANITSECLAPPKTKGVINNKRKQARKPVKDILSTRIEQSTRNVPTAGPRIKNYKTKSAPKTRDGVGIRRIADVIVSSHQKNLGLEKTKKIIPERQKSETVTNKNKVSTKTKTKRPDPRRQSAPPPTNNFCTEPTQIYPNNNYIVPDNESSQAIEEGIKIESEVDQEMLSGKLLFSPQYNGDSILEENSDNFRHPQCDPLANIGSECLTPPKIKHRKSVKDKLSSRVEQNTDDVSRPVRKNKNKSTPKNRDDVVSTPNKIMGRKRKETKKIITRGQISGSVGNNKKCKVPTKMRTYPPRLPPCCDVDLSNMTRIKRFEHRNKFHRTVECKICNFKFISGSTGSLARHMRTKHTSGK